MSKTKLFPVIFLLNLSASFAGTTGKISGLVTTVANGESVAGADILVDGTEFGASSEDIARTVHAHPTHTEAVKEAALAVDKRPIHF